MGNGKREGEGGRGEGKSRGMKEEIHTPLYV